VKRFEPKPRLWLLLITGLAALYCLGFIVVPMIESRLPLYGSFLRWFYRPTCHQMPDRCLDLGAGPLAVCARCAGLYAGGLAGLVASLVSGFRIKPRLWWIAIALVPSAVDFGMAQLGLPHLTNWPRFWVATAPGVLVGLLLADAIAQLTSHVGTE
jgi:uncharacterized membrane protein